MDINHEKLQSILGILSYNSEPLKKRGAAFENVLRLDERKRPGVSELLGTLAMVSITLIAAALVVGWVNGQATVSENQYGQDVAGNVNYLNEHFEILSAQFSGFSSSNCQGTVPTRYCQVLQISIYNTGNVALSIKSITITGSVSSVSGKSLYVLATQSSTWAYTSSSYSTPISGCSPSNSQYTYTYTTTTVTSSSTTTVVATNTATTTAAIPQNLVPPAVFTIKLPPGSSSCPWFVVGKNYQIQVLGLYGNQVTLQTTASG